MVGKVRERQRGFSLPEMLTVIAIFAVLGTIIIARFRDADDTTILTNLAHDIALSIRQAQVYSISVQGAEGDFDIGYGVGFDLDSPNVYRLFHDTTTPGKYTNGDEVLQIFTLSSGYGISRFCILNNAGVEDCIPSPNYLNDRTFGFAFQRPNPEPTFSTGGSIRNPAGMVVYVRSPKGNERKVHVFNTGQISVEQ